MNKLPFHVQIAIGGPAMKTFFFLILLSNFSSLFQEAHSNNIKLLLSLKRFAQSDKNNTSDLVSSLIKNDSNANETNNIDKDSIDRKKRQFFPITYSVSQLSDLFEGAFQKCEWNAKGTDPENMTKQEKILMKRCIFQYIIKRINLPQNFAFWKYDQFKRNALNQPNYKPWQEKAMKKYQKMKLINKSHLDLWRSDDYLYSIEKKEEEEEVKEKEEEKTTQVPIEQPVSKKNEQGVIVFMNFTVPREDQENGMCRKQMIEKIKNKFPDALKVLFKDIKVN